MNDPQQIRDLKNYDELYYNSGKSPISDTKYDVLKGIAKDCFPNHFYFTEVGSDVNSKNAKVKLPYVFGSLNKVKTEDQFLKWYDSDETYIVSEKLDGISIYVKYIDIELIQATTRGNGTIGQDITEKAKWFCPTPKNNIGTLEVRGEVLLYNSLYKQLGGKNRRNCAAGLLNQKGIKNCELLNVKFYELINASNNLENEKNFEKERFKKLHSNFIDVNFSKIKIFYPGTLTIKSLTDTLNQWKAECEEIYDIDGLVITKNISKRENVYYPKNKVAFKVDNEFEITKVTGCRWETSRTGRIKPVLKIDPVELQGVTISNVTAHNNKYIQDNKIGIGTEVKIQRSGDVIPYILSSYNLSFIKSFEIHHCPTCKSKLEISGVDIMCTNENCFVRVAKSISYFFSTLEVEYFSEKTVENLMKKLNLISIEDFYNLTAEDMNGLKGFGDKKIKKIISEIKKTLNCKSENLLSAFGISGIGTENAKNLFKRYSFDKLFEVNSIDDIDGFGQITSDKFVEGMKKNKSLYNFLQDKGLYFISNETKTVLSNKIFTLTGSGNCGRKEYQQKIEQLGGSVKGISAKTNFLVTNDLSSMSGKMKKAQKLNIGIISYDDLDEMLS